MRLRIDQLDDHLTKALAPVYLLTGDEPLQLGEAADAVRHQAREDGYSGRDILDAGKNFDWNELTAEANNLSLFAERRVIDLRLTSAAIGRNGSQALTEYAARPPADTLLLLTCPKLDRSQQSSKWVKALDQIGTVVQIWPVDEQRLQPWIERRMRQHGLIPEADVVAMLAERVEGNLLAAAQEIDKLLLMSGPGIITAAQLVEAVADSARFDIFGLVDNALLGKPARVTRMLSGLRAEGVPPTVVLWALAREIRQLASMAFAIEKGQSADQVMAAHHVWNQRKAIVRQGLTRLKRRRWQQLLAVCARGDRTIKGQEKGDPWEILLDIATIMAGVKPLLPARR
ncbi:DNA polymerase III delta subunit [hydrothermal vent metagenome]|uniref:DNA polymerase III subunit delta n=1 Tax=hydrothermal vent metagenome TaxID=652676 RepID=A0A3B1BKE3_9ZZZZ